MKLSEKLTERGRLPIFAAVDTCLNDQVRDVAELFNEVFENLQYSTRPTINLVIPSYYKLSTMGALDEQDSLEIGVLKANIMQILEEKFFSSITQFHWIATLLDPGFKSFSFLPNSTPADRKFKRDLLKDLPGWLATLDHQTTSGTTQESLPSAVSNIIELSEPEIEEPPLKKKSLFGSMLDNTQPSMHPQNTALSLQEEYEMYITGEATSDYDEEDPLTYWATIHRRLSILGKLVRQVLCCPATSAQSERDFSHFGLIITARRSLISPKYVSALEFIASAHRAGVC